MNEHVNDGGMSLMPETETSVARAGMAYGQPSWPLSKDPSRTGKWMEATLEDCRIWHLERAMIQRQGAVKVFSFEENSTSGTVDT